MISFILNIREGINFMCREAFNNSQFVLISTINSIFSTNFVQYMFLISRWQILRLTMLPSGFLEPFIENILLGIIFAFSSCHLCNVNFLQAFVLHLTLWFTSDAILLLAIEKVCDVFFFSLLFSSYLRN